MSDYRFGDDYKLSIYPKEAMDCYGEIDLDKVEAIEIDWVDFIREPDDKNRWFQLFGTPEKTARTLANACGESDFECGACPAVEAYCHNGDYDALLEWLSGDA